MSSSISITLGEVAASLVLIGVAIAVSFWRRAELEQDIAVAVFRSFIQLTAIGYVIQAIFDTDSLWLVGALLAGMVSFGTWTARGRRRVHSRTWYSRQRPISSGSGLLAGGAQRATAAM